MTYPWGLLSVMPAAEEVGRVRGCGGCTTAVGRKGAAEQSSWCSVLQLPWCHTCQCDCEPSTFFIASQHFTCVFPVHYYIQNKIFLCMLHRFVPATLQHKHIFYYSTYRINPLHCFHSPASYILPQIPYTITLEINIPYTLERGLRTLPCKLCYIL